MSALDCCVKLDGHRYRLQHLGLLLCVLCAQLTFFSFTRGAVKMEQSTRRKCSGETQNRCGGEQRRHKDIVAGRSERRHTAACRRPLQRWNNPRHLSQKFVQTTCSEHKRVEKKSFPAVSVQDRKRGHKQETSLTLDRGRSAGGRRRRQTFSKKAKFTPNAGYDLKSNASKFFLYN